MRIQLFEQMGVFLPNGQDVLPQSRKARALLAILAMASPQQVARSELAELLWSLRGREQARASLRQSIHVLVEMLKAIDPGLLRVERSHLRLDTTLISVDAAIVLSSSGARPEGLALYRPKLLEDLAVLDPAFDRWRDQTLRRVTALARARAEDALAAIESDFSKDRPHDTGDANPDGIAATALDAIVTAAECLIGIDRAHEGAWQSLIRVCLAKGDRAGAVAAFERCRHALADIASLTPAQKTVELLGGIRQPPRTGLSAPSDRGAPQRARSAISPMGHRVRLGVIPLRYLDPGKPDELSLGLAEEITTALSRVNWISCVGPTSLVARSSIVQQDEAWQELGLDFVLEGTVQRSGGKVRVTVRLMDLHAGRQIVWARRFDREESDTLSLQEEITANIAAQLEPELLMLEGERAQNRAKQWEKEKTAADGTAQDGKLFPSHASADELVLRAIPSISRLEPATFRVAGELLAAAISIDPNSATAHAWYAYWHLFQVGQGWSDDPERDTLVGGDLAERAVALDSGNARALTISGHVRGFLRRQPDEALVLHERALSLNPNLALAWCFSGLALSYLGRHEEAIFRAETARRLAPFDPHAFFFEGAAGMPHLLLGQHERTVEISIRSLALNAAFSSAYKGHLSALGHLERFDDAARICERLLLLEPGLTIEDAIFRSPLKVPADLAHYAEGLRKGGLPYRLQPTRESLQDVAQGVGNGICLV